MKDSLPEHFIWIYNQLADDFADMFDDLKKEE